MILKVTISVNVIRSGSMAMSRLFPKKVKMRLVSAVTTSFVESNIMRSIVAKAPSVAPAANVATVVTVVVTVEIMTLNCPLLWMKCFYKLYGVEGIARKRRTFVIPWDRLTPIMLPVLSVISP